MVRRRAQEHEAAGQAAWREARRPGDGDILTSDAISGEPLDKEAEEIRLLALLAPLSADRHREPDDVKCQLWHFSLKRLKERNAAAILAARSLDVDIDSDLPLQRSNNLEYVALSYTWGDAFLTRSIEVNGSQVLVSANLEAALRVLREKDFMRQGCGIWADALCINQRNTQERGEEVVRMREIYKKAKSVIIWVGEEGADGAKAINLVKTLAVAYNDGTHAALAESIRNGTSALPAGSWSAFCAFMSRPYWNRVWILQEVAMGNPSTPILCGRHSTTWGELYDALYNCANTFLDLFFSSVVEECAEEGIAATGLKRNHLIQLNRQQMIEMDAAPARILPMLDVARKCLATDDKDRVYGILGMMPEGLTSRISADYTRPLRDIYTTFAKEMILYRNDLLILEECTSPPMLDAPSWVPNWTFHDHFRLFGGEPTYNAALERKAELCFGHDNRLLICNGIEIGIVDGLGATYFQSGQSNDPRDNVQQAQFLANPYGSEGALETAVWQTLVGNRTADGKPAPATSSCLLECGLESSNHDSESSPWRGRKAFNQLMERNRDLQMGGRALGSFFPLKQNGTDDPPASRDPLERMFRMWRSRRPLVTETGHIGMGAVALQKKDKIFVLLGCTVPVILRPVAEGPLQVVGCCYLQGYMEGEAVHEMEQGKLHQTKICIC